MKEAFSDIMPRCCGKRMQPLLEGRKFIELWCPFCSDTIYVKKERLELPQLAGG